MEAGEWIAFGGIVAALVGAASAAFVNLRVHLNEQATERLEKVIDSLSAAHRGMRAAGEGEEGREIGHLVNARLTAGRRALADVGHFLGRSKRDELSTRERTFGEWSAYQYAVTGGFDLEGRVPPPSSQAMADQIIEWADDVGNAVSEALARAGDDWVERTGLTG